MIWISSEVVSVIYYLMPGFIAAWIFYGLTGYVRASPFERVVEALILTVIIRVLTTGVREVAFVLGAKFSYGNWTEDVGLAWSVVLALAIGLGFAVSANNDFPLRLFRKVNKSKCIITVNTADPSEWYGAFANNRGWVTLHLAGERRLFGWPDETGDRIVTFSGTGGEDVTYSDGIVIIPPEQFVGKLRKYEIAETWVYELNKKKYRLDFVGAGDLDAVEPSSPLSSSISIEDLPMFLQEAFCYGGCG